MAAKLTVFRMMRFIVRLFCRLFSKLWRLGIVSLVELFVGGHDRLAIHILHDDLELVHEEERLGAFLGQRVEPLLEGGDFVGGWPRRGCSSRRALARGYIGQLCM